MRRKAEDYPSLIELSITGLDVDSLTSINVESSCNPDAVLNPRAASIVRSGDVWLLDRHRLTCGDSTVPSVVAAARGKLIPTLMVTDPPYGVDYDANWRNERLPVATGAVGRVLNDTRSNWRFAWDLFCGDIIYIWCGDRHTYSMLRSIDNEFEVRSQIVWVKSAGMIGRGHYNYRHESCWYAIRRGGTSFWVGDNTQATVWHINNKKLALNHSTQKPVECMRRPIANHEADCIYDPFVGSGTTIIAAEIEKRTCCAVELNPAYACLAVRRWQNFTGQMATLEATGENFAEVVRRRQSEAKAAE